MKKWIVVLLVALMTVGMAACGTISDSPVAILWSGEGVVHVPSDLINAMERAMYIENVEYEHYGANGDAAAQLQQAQTALDAGCDALMVEMVDGGSAQTIVDAAKAKNVPVVFFNSQVDASVLDSYEKCALVTTDETSIAKVYAKMVTDAIITEKKGFCSSKVSYVLTEDLDRNEDGKLTYAGEGVEAVIETINATLVEKGLPALEKISNTDLTTAELILTATDVAAKDMLIELQQAGYNADRLKTHYIPVFTAGNAVDYKAYVMETMPVPPFSLDTQNKDEQKKLDEWWSSEEVEAWKATTANLCNLAIVEWTDLNEYLYSTVDVIGAGRMAGTAMEDKDAIATSAAAAMRNLLKGKTAADGIENADGCNIKVPYTTYVG